MKKFTLLLCALLAFPSIAQTTKIASWNIAWLSSHQYNKRQQSDYQELVKYAKQLDADVIALQEVENGQWASKVFGDKYDYYFTEKDWVQRVGVAVRKSSGFSVDAIEYKALDVGRVRYGMDVTLTRNGKSLRLLAVHLKSGCFDKSLTEQAIADMPNTSKRDKRAKTACEKLAKQMAPLEAWIDQRAKEDIPYMVIGDFNRRFAQDIANKRGEEEGLWQAIDDEGLEDLFTPTNELDSACWGGYYKDYIDHIVMDPRAVSMFSKDSFEQLVFEGKYSRERSQNLSDHCPIAVSLSL